MKASILVASMTREELYALPAVVDVPTAARALGIGRTTAYKLAKNDQFPARIERAGTQYRVITADLLRVVGLTEGAEVA